MGSLQDYVLLFLRTGSPARSWLEAALMALEIRQGA